MSNIESPEEEIARLSGEVARLQAELQSGVSSAPTVASVPAHSSGKVRAFFAVLLITIGTLLAPVAVVAAWTKAEVTNTDRFVATVAPLADDPALQAFLVDEIVAAVDDNVDLDTIASDLFDGLSTLGLPPKAEQALKLLEQPAVEGVRSLVRSAAEKLIASDAFAQAWDQTLRISHTQLLAALQGDTTGAVVISDTGELGIQARTAYQLLDVLGFILPWVSILLIAAGVFTAGKKARALVWAGLALLLSMVILAAGVSIGRITFRQFDLAPVPAQRGGRIDLRRDSPPRLRHRPLGRAGRCHSRHRGLARRPVPRGDHGAWPHRRHRAQNPLDRIRRPGRHPADRDSAAPARRGCDPARRARQRPCRRGARS